MAKSNLTALSKCPTGINGFDEICGGGLPRARPTLLSGYAGTGKSLFAIEFIVHGIEQFNENGVFVSFEEKPEDLSANVTSLGFDLANYLKNDRLRIVSVELHPYQKQVESGEFDLEALFLRLGAAVDSIGAKRIALDGVESLFSAFEDLSTLRAEFSRLMIWLKNKGLTAIVTTERGKDELSRHGLEEYIADCVISLDHRVDHQLATRRLRIVKYRGAAHGSDEYPFLLDKNGFSVMPITSAGLSYKVSNKRVSSGIAGLDDMLAGGYYRGSTILVSGTSGTGKSSISAHFANAACKRGERCLYIAMEESANQIERNMQSIGIDLAQWRNKDLLRFHAVRPTANGLEIHLGTIIQLVKEFEPKLVVIDPISAFDIGVSEETVKLMLIRAVDLFKTKGITAIFNCLTYGGSAEEATAVGMSSLVDVWLLLRNFEFAGERTRGLYVCKARGMAHSNQVREFVLTDKGIRLENIVLGDNGEILTGSARLFYLEKSKVEQQAQKEEHSRRQLSMEKKRKALEAKIAAERAEFEDESMAFEAELRREELLSQSDFKSLKEIAASRGKSNERGGDKA